jgi:hypothetical protein
VPENFAAIIENGATVARKTCNFAIAFQGTPNRAVRLSLPRIKGGVALGLDATAEIGYEVFFTGQRGQRNVIAFHGHEQILESAFDEVNEGQDLIFGCGQDGIIRGNASVLVNNVPSNAQVAVAVVEKFGVKIDSVSCN